MSKEQSLKPMFKWSGGKRRELKHVLELMPGEFDNYCEPFVGGGAVWFNLENNSNLIGDFNTDVINFYKVVKNHGKKFIDDLNSFAIDYKKLINKIKPKMREDYKPLADQYYYWRDTDFTSDYDIAKRFYILRNLSFSGMLRYNKKGKYNVPYGYYKNFKFLEWNNDYEKLFHNTEFLNTDWKNTVSKVSGNSFVFLDPPYTRKFTKYSNKGDFDLDNHRELFDWFSSRQSRAMIILNKDDFTFNLYEDFIVREYEFSYGVRYRKDRLTKEDTTTFHFVAVNY